MAIRERALSLEQFLQLPEQEPPLELTERGVTQKVSPKVWHSRLQVALVEQINKDAFPTKRAFAFSELRSSFGGLSKVPDVSVFRWSRIPRDENGRLLKDSHEAPDIAIEIVSPEQSVNELIDRCLWFVAHGVQIALLVDPDDESVIAFRPGERIAVRRGAERLDLGELLPEVDLTVEDLFASLNMA